MKVLKLLDGYREVKYLGLTVVVSKEHNYLACDSDGTIWGYEIEPILVASGDDSWAFGKEHITFSMDSVLGLVENPRRESSFDEVIEVDLNGVDWKDTLVAI